jgi:sec-independent protein translocase protein TatA
MNSLAFLSLPQGSEFIIILIVVLLIFGPKNLPKLGKMIGNTLKEFKGAASKVTESLDEEENKSSAPEQIKTAKTEAQPQAKAKEEEKA